MHCAWFPRPWLRNGGIRGYSSTPGVLSPSSYPPSAPHTYRCSALLQTEHIDNPKGYGENEDARKYDNRLRGVSAANFFCSIFSGPYIHSLLTYVTLWHIYSTSSERVAQPRELEIDPRTGMKNYIANGQTHKFIDISPLTRIFLQRMAGGTPVKLSSAGPWKNVFDSVGLNVPMAKRLMNTRHTDFLDRL